MTSVVGSGFIYFLGGLVLFGVLLLAWMGARDAKRASFWGAIWSVSPAVIWFAMAFVGGPAPDALIKSIFAGDVGPFGWLTGGMLCIYAVFYILTKGLIKLGAATSASH
jgi:hypothetical protein